MLTPRGAYFGAPTIAPTPVEAWVENLNVIFSPTLTTTVNALNLSILFSPSFATTVNALNLALFFLPLL